MNNCDLCGKEGRTEFTVKSKHLRWVLSEDLQKLDTYKNNWLTKNICEDCFKKIFGKLEENCTIGQNKEKHYRPFEDVAELIFEYQNRFHVNNYCIEEPIIWVKKKVCNGDERSLITAYDIDYVFIQDVWIDLKELFERYTFLDGSVCGEEE